MTLEWVDNSKIVNFCKRYSKRNLWRVECLAFDFDDLLQECFIVFYECKNRYSQLDNDEFFKKFIKSLNNRVINLVKKQRNADYYLQDNFDFFVDNSIDVESLVDLKLKLENIPYNFKKYFTKYKKSFVPNKKLVSDNPRYTATKDIVELKKYLFN